MRKIKITEKQNFSIHIEDKIEEDSFFFHEYEIAVKHLNDIWSDQALPRQIYDDLLIENPNNIIAFCGERGSGKSSAMLSFVNLLHSSGERDIRFNFSEPVKNNNWDSKIIVDPSVFDGVHNIVDIVLAHIFQSFNDAYQKDNQIFDKYERERLYKLMSKVYKNLSIIKNKEKMLDDEYDEAGNIGKLQKLGESIQLKKSLSELISVYLEMISKVKCKQGEKCEKLLIAIDDLDLCNEYAYEAAEQIRKYLILPNVVIFMAIKIDQLKLGIEEKNRKNFKNVIAERSRAEIIDSEISDMSERYLTKLIPMARRIFLPELNSREFCLELSDGRNLNALNAEKTIVNLIREKTGMIFGTIKENTYFYFVPENLREFVNFVIYLLKLENAENLESVCLKNLYDFKGYFINDMLKTKIRGERLDDLKEVLDCDQNTKNYNMRLYLNKLLIVNSNNSAPIRTSYEYPMTSFAAVVDGLDNMSAYLTKKEDYQLIYYLKVYYTIILNQDLLENKSLYQLTGGFIWGNKINSIMPSSRLENGQYFSRGRFILDIQECWEIVCKAIPLPTFSLEGEIIDIFSSSEKKQLYVKGIEEKDKWRKASAWLLMTALTSGANLGTDGKCYVYDAGFIYDNHSVVYRNVSPSIENYFGALSTIENTVEKASLQMLGLTQENVEKIKQSLITENKKQIKTAQTIAINPELSMQLLEYCQKNGDCRNTEDESRTSELYKKFFKNVQSFLQEQGLETVDMSTLWIPIEEVYNTVEGKLKGVKIDICKIYADMHEKQKSILEDEPDNSLETQKLKLAFSEKVNNISQMEYIGKVKPIPGNLRNKTAKWAKEKLEDLANYIQDYTYKNKRFPDGFEKDTLINLYSEIVDLYVDDPKAETSEAQRKTYQRIVQMVKQSN